MTKKKQSAKVKKQQTVKEFKAWIDGMLEIQTDDWCPNIDQWKKIREKIDNLDETPIEIEVIRNAPTVQPAQHFPVSQMAPPPPQYQYQQPAAAPSGSLLTQPFNPNMIRLLPTEDGEVHHIEVLPITQPSIETVSSTVKVSGKTIATPNDLSGSGTAYKSGFA